MAHELHELPRIGATSNQKFLQMFHGQGQFFQKAPLAAGGFFNTLMNLFFICWAV
jgi:hypothetical protein